RRGSQTRPAALHPAFTDTPRQQMATGPRPFQQRVFVFRQQRHNPIMLITVNDRGPRSGQQPLIRTSPVINADPDVRRTHSDLTDAGFAPSGPLSISTVATVSTTPTRSEE